MWKFIILSVTLVNLPEYGYFSYVHFLHLLISNQSINQLYILEGGVVGTCGVLCHALAQKTGSQALGAVCDILCDVVGIKEFIKLVH
jgi:hypothetical protein